jgi:hypothetical protein
MLSVTNILHQWQSFTRLSLVIVSVTGLFLPVTSSFAAVSNSVVVKGLQVTGPFCLPVMGNPPVTDILSLVTLPATSIILFLSLVYSLPMASILCCPSLLSLSVTGNIIGDEHNPLLVTSIFITNGKHTMLLVTTKFLWIKKIIHPEFIHTNNASIIAYIAHTLENYSLFNIYCIFIFHITFITTWCQVSTDNWIKITNTTQVGNTTPITMQDQPN